MQIIWPDVQDPYMSEIPTADYICRLVRAKLAGTERDMLPPGITKITMHDDYHRAPTTLFNIYGQAPTTPFGLSNLYDDVISVYLWPTMKATTGVMVWPVGHRNKNGHSGAIRYFRFNLTTKSYMNFGPVNGCIIDHTNALPMTKAPSGRTNVYQYESSKVRSTRIESDGSFVTKASMHLLTRVYPDRSLKLTIRSPGERHDGFYMGNLNRTIVGFSLLDRGVYGGRVMETTEWERRCPGIVLDLTDPVFPVSNQDLLFMMV
jgi:hypothetical protein